MDPDIPLTKVPICMKAAMRFAISKQLEKPRFDSESDFSSVKSDEYKLRNRLEFKVPYKKGQFLEDPDKVKMTLIDETVETSKTVFLNEV